MHQNKAVQLLISPILIITILLQTAFFIYQPAHGIPKNDALTTPIATGSNEISITDQGINPASITIEAGTTITWQNDTSQTHTLKSGDAQYEIFLPAILKSNSTTTYQLSQNQTASPQAESFSATILPGESFSYAFTEIGTHPYYLATNPAITGEIIVIEQSGQILNLNPIGDQTASLGQTLTFSVTAVYNGNQPLTYNATPLPLPDNISFHAATGLFTFTPDESQTGSFQLTFTVTDGELTDSETITINTPQPNPSDDTILAGRILDANDAAQGITTPLIGATITNNRNQPLNHNRQQRLLYPDRTHPRQQPLRFQWHHSHTRRHIRSLPS